MQLARNQLAAKPGQDWRVAIRQLHSDAPA
jgi:hypothetical protein